MQKKEKDNEVRSNMVWDTEPPITFCFRRGKIFGRKCIEIFIKEDRMLFAILTENDINKLMKVWRGGK